MKAFLIVILSFSFALSTLGQIPHIDYPDSGFTNKEEAKNLIINDSKEGKWIEYWDPLHIPPSPYYCLIVYKDDKTFGIERRYSMNGKLYLICSYKDGKEDGIEKCYYDNGELFWEAPYINGKENGIMKLYDESGKICEEITFKNGKEKKDIMCDSTGNEIK